MGVFGDIVDGVNDFGEGVKDFFTPSKANPETSKEQLNRTRAFTDSMQGRADAAQGRQSTAPMVQGPNGPQYVSGPQYYRGPTKPGVAPSPTELGQSRQNMVNSLNMTRDAAMGNVPSAADLQAIQASDRLMAKQRALGASLQGRSAGGALTASTEGAAAGVAQIQEAALANRAAEQAAARNQLLTGSLGLGQQDINVADLSQRAAIANQEAGLKVEQLRLLAAQGNQDAILKLQQLDDAYRLGTQGQFLQYLGLESGLAGGIDSVGTANAQASNQFKGGIISGGVQGFTSLFGG